MPDSLSRTTNSQRLTTRAPLNPRKCPGGLALITLEQVGPAALQHANSRNSESPPTSLKEAFLELIPWVGFLASLALLLRPVLITNVAADDLLNPFSQIYHAGTGIDPILRHTIHDVGATGHFNYIGQAVGNLAVLIHTYLIGNFSFRYSTVYGFSRYLSFLVTFIIVARAIRDVSAPMGLGLSVWRARFLVLLVFAATLQIHVPWSNDPVASYLFAGYLTVALGIGFIILYLRAFHSNRIVDAIWVGVVGVVAVQYYEFNTFAVLSVSPLMAMSLWQARAARHGLLRRILISAICVVPAAVITLYFYFQNKAASADYSGTAMSFSGPFLRTFRNGMVGALPAASLKIASDWLQDSIHPTTQAVSSVVSGIALLLVMMRFWRKSPTTSTSLSFRKLLLFISPFLIYWLGATFTQTATLKVQQEAVRLGQVYNYYAVGSTCLVIIGILFVMWLEPRIARANIRNISAKILLLAVSLLCVVQFVVNWNVMVQFNGATSGSSRLMIAFAEAPPMDQRCAALDLWKTMGWPEYYWLDMELGLNSAYRIYRNEEFCAR